MFDCPFLKSYLVFIQIIRWGSQHAVSYGVKQLSIEHSHAESKQFLTIFFLSAAWQSSVLVWSETTVNYMFSWCHLHATAKSPHLKKHLSFQNKMKRDNVAICKRI